MNDHTQIQAQIDRLHSECLSLMIASLDEHGHPQVSSAPYALIDNHYYIFVSKLSAHTQHIQQHPHIGILIIEDETKTRNIYARARLSYQAQAAFIERDSTLFATAFEILKQRAGNTLEVLVQLPDFSMVQIKPLQGTLILGFGKAYELDGQKSSAGDPCR